MKKLIAIIVGIIVAVCSTTQVVASTTIAYGPFDVIFYDGGEGNGYYTGAQNWTAEQRADVGASVQAWSSLIANVAGRQIQMHAFWYNFSGSILGGSYSPSNGDGTTSWNYGEHVWRDGVNYAGLVTVFDTLILYDTDAAEHAWNFGVGAPGGSEVDFRSVVAHEIGHSLGWTDTYYPSPWDDWGNTWGTASDPFGYAGFNGLSAWDKNLVDSSGNRPINAGKGTPGNFDQVDNPVFWDGSNAGSYYGDDVPIYAPKPYEPGSSLSHLDYSTFPDILMSPYISLGQMNRTVSELEWAMMKDMGWSIIPAPGAMILASIGVCLVGWLRRRRTL